MSFGSILGKVAGIVVEVVTKITPLVELIKSLIPGLREPLESVEDLIEESGELADDFIDAHRPQLMDLREFFTDLGGVSTAGVEMVDEVLRAADDDTITFDELAIVKQRAEALFEAVIALGKSADGADDAINVLKAAK